MLNVSPVIREPFSGNNIRGLLKKSKVLSKNFNVFRIASFGMYDANADIGFTKYYSSYGNAVGPDGNANNQIVGGLQIYRSRAGGGWSFRIENDFSKLGGDGDDRWRSNALEFSKGPWSIGTSVYTNDIEEGKTDQVNPDQRSLFSRIYPNGLKNRAHKYDAEGNLLNGGGWANGKTYFAPLWVGYRLNNHQIVRIGQSHKSVQQFTQDFTHRSGFLGLDLFGHSNYFNNYDVTSINNSYQYFGYYNPYSLWGY